MSRGKFVVGVVIFVFIFVVLSILGYSALRITQKRIVTPVGVIGTAYEITVSSFVNGKTINFIDNKDFKNQLAQLAPRVKKINISFRSLASGRAVYPTTLPGQSSGPQNLVLDPIVFTDPILGTYGYTFSYVDRVLVIDISLDDTKITSDGLDSTFPLLILSVAKYADSLPAALLQLNKTSIDAQISVNSEIYKLGLNAFHIFEVHTL